ncbi:MAG TPA: hypothetical protein VNQ55_06935, partial [Parapedobacter sp.]|nr:hypothetical protein [Parapedobacter sp.]
ALRTVWGLDLDVVESRFGGRYRSMLGVALQPFESRGDVSLVGSVATLTRKGKLFADHIASELFVEHGT